MDNKNKIDWSEEVSWSIKYADKKTTESEENEFLEKYKMNDLYSVVFEGVYKEGRRYEAIMKMSENVEKNDIPLKRIEMLHYITCRLRNRARANNDDNLERLEGEYSLIHYLLDLQRRQYNINYL